MTVTVRHVERDDAQAIAAVHVSAWFAGYRGVVSDEFLSTITLEKRAAGWAGLLSQDELPPVTVGVLDGTVVGFCALATPSRDADAHGEVAEIAALNVSADAWHVGVGTALMRDALDRLRGDGWPTVTLWVMDGNERAQGFYRTFGSELDGSSDVHGASGSRTLRMRLPLSD